MTTATATPVLGSKVVSRNQWLAASRALLDQEKQLTRQRDALAQQRQQLPWVKVEKEYFFDTPTGKASLAELFGVKSQLFVYHFMFGPEWAEGCPGCSLMADHLSGSFMHLPARDVTPVVVSRAPLSKIEPFKQRMGWDFNWVSSQGSDFNRDFKVTFTPDDIAAGKGYNFGTTDFKMDEAPGASVFYKDESGDVYHTYSTYGRGLEDFLAVYTLLDRLPKGREESNLARPMAWVRHHDRYDTAAAPSEPIALAEDGKCEAQPAAGKSSCGCK